MLDEIFSTSRVQDEVIRLNQEQLSIGIDSNDKKIQTLKGTIFGQAYSPYTVTIKKLKNQPYNIVTLKDTGDFYDSFKVRKVLAGWEVIANYQKEDGDINDNLPNDIDELGLTPESLAELVYEAILPRLTKMLLAKI